MTRLSDLRKTADAAIGADGLDSAQVTTIATNAGIAVYTALDSLPSTGLTSGDQAWVESSGRLYISNGSGWYNIALVNASPTLTLDQSGTILMGGSNPLTITVTASATDTDDNQNIISFSVESDGNMVGTSTTVSQDSSVFTITAISADSGGTAGDFTLTFKATDQIAVDNEALSFSLKFSNIIDSSAETIFLMKARGASGGDNESASWIDSAGTSQSLTKTGDPIVSTFSPYRSGGYSAWFDGANTELQVASSSDFAYGTGNFTIEGWIFPLVASTWQQIVGHDGYPSAGAGVVWLSDQNKIHWYQSGSTGGNMASGVIPIGEWTHFAVVREGTGTNQTKLYINGVQANTMTSSTNYAADGIEIGNNQTYDFYGYMRDIRIVKGTAVYTSAFSVPTEPLTAVTNTKLLTCQSPFATDNSSSDHTVTVANGVGVEPFGPYNYEPFNSTSDGGAILFDGVGDTYHGDLTDHIGSGDWTVECWVWINEGAGTGSRGIFQISNTSGGLQANATTNITLAYRASSYSYNWVIYTKSSQTNTSTASIRNQWNHVALVKDSSANSVKFYVNGKEVQEITNDTTNYNATRYFVLGGYYSTSYLLNGSIADFRVTKSKVYTAEFDPPTSRLTRLTDTKALVNNASDAKIYDAAQGMALETDLGAETSTSQKKWTASPSVYFDNSFYGVQLHRNADGSTYDRYWWQNFLEDDFTFEGWFYLNADDGSNMYLQLGANGGNWTTSGQTFLLYSASGVFYAQWNNGGGASSSTWTEPDGGAWFHYACCSDGGNLKQYVDGTQVGSTTTFNIDADYVTGGTWTARLGGYTPNSAYHFDGYMQDVRITRGLARYPSAFTAPTAEFEL